MACISTSSKNSILAETDVDTVPIVSNLEEFESTIFHNYLYGRRASIHGIFNELFEGMHWSHYNLARSDLVYNILIERLPAVVRSSRGKITQWRTLILLGASGKRSGPSAFLFVPLETPASISISSCFSSA